MRLLIALIALTFTLPSLTHAEILSPQNDDIIVSMSVVLDDSKDETSDWDSIDAPQEYITEAKDFETTCNEDDVMPLYFDCSCMAKDYLNKRIERGADASVSSIRNSMGVKCKDGDGIAAKMIDDCMSGKSRPPKNIDLDHFCPCNANTFRRLFEQTEGQMSPRMKMKYRSMSRLKCSDPEASKKVHGDF